MLHFYHQTTVISNEPVVLPLTEIEKKQTPGIIEKIDEPVYHFLSRFCNVDATDTLVVSTSDSFNIRIRCEKEFRSIINLRRLNDVKHLCSFLVDVNHKLRNEGLFICCLETSKLRKQ